MANCNYKVKIKDIQNKYKFKIFCMGDKYDDTEIREEIEALEEELTDTKEEVERANLVYNALPKVEGTGESITLNDTANAPLKLDLKGNSYQDSTTGKNLFNKDSGFELGYIRASDGVFISENVSCIFNQYVPVIANEKYKLTANTNLRNITLVYYDSTKTYISKEQASNNSTGTFTIPANVSFAIFGFSYNATTTITQDIIDELNIQLEQGTTATEYEKYTGGMASPNPDYPQAINVVTGNNTISICGKNIFNGVLELGNFQNETGEKLDNNSYIINSNPIPVEELTNYKISSNGTGIKMYVFEYKEDLSYNLTGRKTVNANEYLTTNSGTKYINFRTIETNTNLQEKIQVEQGTTATTYEAYKGQTYPINLGSIELCKIGTYQDYFYKNNGNWYLKKNIGKVVMNGSESEWSNPDTYQGIHQYQLYKNDVLYINDNVVRVVSSHFVGVNYNNSWTKDNVITIGGSVIRIMTSQIATLEAFKTWLGNNNNNVYYVLATPTDTQITDTTLISQLNALEKALAYQNQTNISQTNADKPFIIDASTLYDLNNLVTRLAVLETE